MHCLLLSDKTNPAISILSMSNGLRQPSKTYFRIMYSHRSMSVSKPYLHQEKLSSWLWSGFPLFIFYIYEERIPANSTPPINHRLLSHNGIKALIDTVSNCTEVNPCSTCFPSAFSSISVHLGSDVAQLKPSEKPQINFSGSCIML